MTRSIPIPEIEITQDMIRYSMPGDCCACAISLTILENTGLHPVLWDDTAYIFRTSNDQNVFANYLHDDNKNPLIEKSPIAKLKLADDLLAWTIQFDSQAYNDLPKPIRIASTDTGELVIVE